MNAPIYYPLSYVLRGNSGVRKKRGRKGVQFLKESLKMHSIGLKHTKDVALGLFISAQLPSKRWLKIQDPIFVFLFPLLRPLEFLLCREYFYKYIFKHKQPDPEKQLVGHKNIFVWERAYLSATASIKYNTLVKPQWPYIPALPTTYTMGRLCYIFIQWILSTRITENPKVTVEVITYKVI